MRSILSLLGAALLAAGCGAPAAERLRCGEKLIVSILYRGGMAIGGGPHYYPSNLPYWVRRVQVDDRRARLEMTQKWAGRDDSGAPTSGEYLLVYELERETGILRVGRAELPATDAEWEEEHRCAPMGEFAFRALEWRAIFSL